MRNFGVKKDDVYDQVYHNPETFTAGFWTGSVLATLFWGFVSLMGVIGWIAFNN